MADLIQHFRATRIIAVAMIVSLLVGDRFLPRPEHFMIGRRRVPARQVDPEQQQREDEEEVEVRRAAGSGTCGRSRPRLKRRPESFQCLDRIWRRIAAANIQ